MLIRRWVWVLVAGQLLALLLTAASRDVSARGLSSQFRLKRIAAFDEPVTMAFRPGDPRLYVGEKPGTVRAVTRDGVPSQTVLDLSDEVSSGYEQGLVGMAFSPDGNHLYVGITDLDGHSRILVFDFRDGRAVSTGRGELLRLEQPGVFHNNGQVLFGPDGMLYLGFGDGGGARFDRSQDLGTLYGKILRIDSQPDGDQLMRSRRITRLLDSPPFVPRSGSTVSGSRGDSRSTG